MTESSTQSIFINISIIHKMLWNALMADAPILASTARRREVQKTFVNRMLCSQFLFLLFRRALALTRCQDDDIQPVYLRVLWYRCLNTKNWIILAEKAFGSQYQSSNFGENCIVTIEKGRVQTKTPELVEDTRREFVFVRSARWQLHVRRLPMLHGHTLTTHRRACRQRNIARLLTFPRPHHGSIVPPL